MENIAICVNYSAAVRFSRGQITFRNHKIIGVVKLNIIADSLQIFGFLLIPLSMFIFLGSSSICPRPDCDRLAYISINLVFTMNLIILCNMTGMMFGEIKECIQKEMYTILASHGITVAIFYILGTPLHATQCICNYIPGK